MIVVTSVDKDPADPEEQFQFFEAAEALHSLRHGKPMSDLVSGLVALPASPVWLPDEADGEASLSVYKTDHPAKSDQSFLLIFRTRHVVTMVNVLSDVTR
jgi:hypothetical protein